MNNRWKLPVFASCIVVGLSGISASAQSTMAVNQPTAVEKFSASSLGFEMQGASSAMRNVTLTVTGPNGYNASAFSSKGVPAIDLSSFGKLRNGMYRYQITAASEETVEMEPGLDNGRGDDDSNAMFKSVAMSGVFHVNGGAIAAKSNKKEK